MMTLGFRTAGAVGGAALTLTDQADSATMKIDSSLPPGLQEPELALRAHKAAIAGQRPVVAVHPKWFEGVEYTVGATLADVPPRDPARRNLHSAISQTAAAKSWPIQLRKDADSEPNVRAAGAPKQTGGKRTKTAPSQATRAGVDIMGEILDDGPDDESNQDRGDA